MSVGLPRHPQRGARNEEQIQAPLSLGSTLEGGASSHISPVASLSPSPPSKDLGLQTSPEDLSGGNSRSQAAHLVQHTLTVHEAQAIPRTRHSPTSRLGSTKIASVRSQMRTQVRADVHRDGRRSGGSAKAAGAHAPAALPPQATRPETRSA